MKLGVIMAILAVAIFIVAACFFSYIVTVLARIIDKEYDYEHDIDHNAYRE